MMGDFALDYVRTQRWVVGSENGNFLLLYVLTCKVGGWKSPKPYIRNNQTLPKKLSPSFENDQLADLIVGIWFLRFSKTQADKNEFRIDLFLKYLPENSSHLKLLVKQLDDPSDVDGGTLQCFSYF